MNINGLTSEDRKKAEEFIDIIEDDIKELLGLVNGKIYAKDIDKVIKLLHKIQSLRGVFIDYPEVSSYRRIPEKISP